MIDEKERTISKLERKIFEQHEIEKNKEENLKTNSIGFQEKIVTKPYMKVNENFEGINLLFKTKILDNNIHEMINCGIKRKQKINKKAKHYYLRSTAKKYEFLSKYIQDNKEALCFSCDSESGND